MKRIALIAIVVMGTCQITMAQNRQVSLNEAMEASLTRVAAQSSLPRSNISVVDAAFCRNTAGDTLLYEIATNAGLTVLLSGSRVCLPVLGVHGNEEGLLLNKIDSLPCGLRLLIDWYKVQIDDSFHDVGMVSSHLQEWHSLINGERQNAPKSGGVSPLLSSLWTQKYPNDESNFDAYNYFMPPGDTCSHCRAGCVAVAMGQVMYYWKHPVLNLQWDSQLDWCNMSDKLHSSNLTYEKNRDAISLFLLMCGMSVEMNYGCGSSGAQTRDARDALVNVFGYKSTAEYKERPLYSDDVWKRMLKEQLDMNRPVIYRGKSTFGGGKGHAFVCDGYNAYGLFHFNWGWGREYGYFSLDNLTPGGNEYNYWHAAIFDIQPVGYLDMCNQTLNLEYFYGFHEEHGHPMYTATPKTMTKLVSAAPNAPASWRTIPSGATAEYVAHKEVVLRPGFTAQYGSNFTARIEPCATCGTRQSDDGRDQPGDVDMTMRVSAEEPQGTVREDGTLSSPPTPMRLYPNPTNGRLTVTGLKRADAVGVFDVRGEEVFRWFIVSNSDGELVLDVSAIPSGIYILRIAVRGEGENVGRFVKE